LSIRSVNELLSLTTANPLSQLSSQYLNAVLPDSHPPQLFAGISNLNRVSIFFCASVKASAKIQQTLTKQSFFLFIFSSHLRPSCEATAKITHPFSLFQTLNSFI
jgi:hypothetical protein